jgi:hypothetical protein
MTDDLEALKARVKELEAAQASPVSRSGGAGSLARIVPRWLVIVAALAFIAWAGADLYLKVQQGRVQETASRPLNQPPIKFSNP